MSPALRVLLATALASSVVQAQAPAPMPDGTNVVLGRVTEIGNNTPVGGAIVTLAGHFDASGRPATPNPGAFGPDLPPSVNVMTTADGYFVVRKLPAGLFTATTRAFGYFNSDFPPTIIELRDSPRPTEVDLRVWKHAAIGGRVVDERGEPIAGIPVSVLRPVASGSGMLLRHIATGLTDDRGEYRLSNLTPGDYAVGVLSTPTTLPSGVAAGLDPSTANREAFLAMSAQLRQSGLLRTYGCPICVSSSHEGHHVSGFVLQRPGLLLPPAPDGRPLGFASTFYPGTTRAADAGVVSLGSGASRPDLDFAIRLMPSVAVAGVLAGPDGPMPHVTLSLAPPTADLNAFDPPGVATAVTDARGAFVFLGITPDDYILRSTILLDVNESTGEGRPLWASQPLSVGDTGVSDLAIVMQPGVRTSGRIEFKDASGPDRPDDRLFLSLQPVRASVWRTVRAVAGADGTFRTAGDPPGRYVVNTAAPPGWYWQTTSLAGRPLLDDVIELGASEVTDLAITFGRTTNRVSGRVLDTSGAPDAHAAVIVFPADSNAWREGIFTSRRTRKVHTTSTGAYDIATLAPGEYFVAAIESRLALNWQDPRLLEGLVARASRISLGAENQQTVVLRAPAAGALR
ncbi:MAG: carboxypeptidase regulatory-like domain-containing protein [Acidobacteria bacterium]|nr:carboxypeptidase regulatory-like domain-containing protein [Acidobacteriota bacterium]